MKNPIKSVSIRVSNVKRNLLTKRKGEQGEGGGK